MIKVRERLYRKVNDVVQIPEHVKRLKQELINEGYEVVEDGFGVLVVKLVDGEIRFAPGSDGIYEYIFRQKMMSDEMSACYNKNVRNFHYEEGKKMVQIINAIGTVVHEGQVKYLYVATCECQNKIARSKSEKGLWMYIGNEKFKCKECGHVLKFAGQAYFKGNTRVDESEVVNATDFDEGADDMKVAENNEPLISQHVQVKEPFNDVNGLIKGIKRKGVTNFQMISAIKENILNIENLKALYSSYPQVFKGSVRYLPVNLRKAAGGVVQETEPDFAFQEGRRTKPVYNTPVTVGENNG